MPELPEVETIRAGLEKHIIRHRIVNVEIRDRKIFPAKENDLIEAKFTAAKRFGKGLVLDLDNGYSIVVHIKLTGQFVYRGDETKNTKLSNIVDGPLPSKFTRVIFKFDQGAVLYFNDIRRFAWMRLMRTAEVRTLPFFKDLGPEPFKDLTLNISKKLSKAQVALLNHSLWIRKKSGGLEIFMQTMH